MYRVVEEAHLDRAFCSRQYGTSRDDNRHFAEPTKTEVRLRKERDGFRRELTSANKKIQRLRGERNEARVKVESLEAALEATQQKIREYEISSNRSSDNILSIGSVSSYDSKRQLRQLLDSAAR